MRRLGGLWQHRDFRALWGAETISQFGSQITFLALPLVAILVLDESTFRVALLTSVAFLPFLLFTLPAGVWVDRLRRRPILIVSDCLRALALITIPIAHWLGVLTIWQLYAVAFVARRRHGLLRRLVPVLPPGPRRTRSDRRRQLQARGQPRCREHRRPGARRRSRRSVDRADRRSRRRDQLPGLGVPARRDQDDRRRASARRETLAEVGARRGPALRLHAPIPARHGGVGRASRTSSARSSSRSCSSMRSASSASRPGRSGSCSRSATSDLLAAALTARRISDRFGRRQDDRARRLPLRARHASDRAGAEGPRDSASSP